MPGAEPRQLDRSGRLFAWASVLLVAETLATLFFVAGTHGALGPHGRTTTDFASFYAAGVLAGRGQAAQVYSAVAHSAVEWAVTERGIDYQFFYYPPVFLLLLAPLARLPYLLAFAVFEAGSLLLYLAAVRPILQPVFGPSRWRWLVPVLAFPALFWTFGLGQNALLSAALFASGTRLVDRRPLLAGALLGALIYKPHLGLLVPVALLAGRRWRALAGAAGSALALCVLSAALFGVQAWADFAAVFGAAHATYENGRIELAGMVSVFAGARVLGLPVTAAYAVQGASSVATAACVAWVWARGASLPLRAATLLTATLLALPVLLLYDLMLLAVAGIWLLTEPGTFFNRRDSRPLLIAGYAVPLVGRSVGLALHVPLAPLVCAATLMTAVFRARSQVSPRNIRNSNCIPNAPFH